MMTSSVLARVEGDLTAGHGMNDYIDNFIDLLATIEKFEAYLLIQCKILSMALVFRYSSMNAEGTLTFIFSYRYGNQSSPF